MRGAPSGTPTPHRTRPSMDHPSPKRVELARRILEHEAGESPDPIGDLTMEMPTLTDSMNMMMDGAMQMVKSIIEPFTRIGLGFVISRDGEVMDMFNEEELRKAMTDAAKEMMHNMEPGGGDPAKDDHLMDSIMTANFEAMTAAAVNNMNLFLLGHQCLFPRSGTDRQEVEFHDADAPLSGDDRPTGGHVELKILSRTDRTMVGQVSNVYEKKELAARMKEQFPDENITATNIECSEIRTFTFDLKSGWITLITETIEVSFPGMSMRTSNRTTVVLL